MRKGTKRSVVFFILLAGMCWLLHGLDEQMLFAYMPYWAALAACLVVLAPFVPRGPWIVKSVALALFAAWLLLYLPNVRSSGLKSFYVDAWSLKPGMTMAVVDEIMKGYTKNPAGPLSGAHMVGVQESDVEHDARILYVHEDYPADWCVVYPKDGVVRRVVIHPD